MELAKGKVLFCAIAQDKDKVWPILEGIMKRKAVLDEEIGRETKRFVIETVLFKTVDDLMHARTNGFAGHKMVVLCTPEHSSAKMFRWCSSSRPKDKVPAWVPGTTWVVEIGNLPEPRVVTCVNQLTADVLSWLKDPSAKTYPWGNERTKKPSRGRRRIRTTPAHRPYFA